MTDIRTRAVGDEWRTWFYTWKLVADETEPVEFPLSAGFGCGSTMKIARGEKISLQTAHKLTGQIGTKLGGPGAEVSASVGSELSETLTYELSSGSEWSYSSRPCEYCFPSARFPDARIRILKRWTLHLPFFVTRKTVFLPGRTYPEILGNCRHAPEKCSNCENTEAAPGAGPVATVTASGGSAHVDRVQLADRESLQFDLKMVLREILSDGETAPEQFYLVDLAGRTQSVSRSDGRHLLYSLDDIDRNIGAVRLYPKSSLLFMTKAREKPEQAPTRSQQPPMLEIELTSENGEVRQRGSISRVATASGFSLVDAELSLQPQLEGREDLLLRVSHGDVADEWPAIVLKSSKKSPSASENTPRRKE
jgi:hypothetical protein